MIDNNAFSLRASFRAARNELAESRRAQLLRAAVLPASMLVASLFILWAIDSSATVATNVMLFGYIFMFGLFLVIAASLSFNGLTTKEKRLLFYMTPFRQSEKFLGQIIVYQLLYAVYYVVCAAVCFMLSLGMALLLMPDTYSLSMFDQLVTSELFRAYRDLPAGMTAAVVLLFFGMSSYYIAGATYFRRHTFLKTTIAIWVFTMVVQMGMVFLALGRDLTPWLSTTTTIGSTAQALLPWMSIAGSLLTIGFNWYMAYYRMCESGIE